MASRYIYLPHVPAEYVSVWFFCRLELDGLWGLDDGGLFMKGNSCEIWFDSYFVLENSRPKQVNVLENTIKNSTKHLQYSKWKKLQFLNGIKNKYWTSMNCLWIFKNKLIKAFV